jgi:hypothetical protein
MKLKRIFGWLLVAVLMVAIPFAYATIVDDEMWFTKGISVGNTQTSSLHTDYVLISNAEIKNLRANKKDLVVSPGAGYFLEFVSATIFHDYGSDVLTESSDNLIIQYGSGTDASAAIESGGFTDANADTVVMVTAVDIAGTATSSLADDELELFNTGSAEIAGNATLDTVWYVKITYRIHKTGL